MLRKETLQRQAIETLCTNIPAPQNYGRLARYSRMQPVVFCPLRQSRFALAAHHHFSILAGRCSLIALEHAAHIICR